MAHAVSRKDERFQIVADVVRDFEAVPCLGDGDFPGRSFVAVFDV
ncbi:hypothetical protein ACFFQF_13960 [Haladaptatus pallidirubidus]